MNADTSLWGIVGQGRETNNIKDEREKEIQG